MRKKLWPVLLLGVLISLNQTGAGAKNTFEVPVEVLLVRDLGPSEQDEAKSVIEVRWRASRVPPDKIAFFQVLLSATYADGTTFRRTGRADRLALSARLEIPSVKASANRPAALIRKLDARVHAVLTKN